MFSIVYNVLYYSWMFIRHRQDIKAVADTYYILFKNRKMITHLVTKASRTVVKAFKMGQFTMIENYSVKYNNKDVD
jgi:hypothetical protein